MDYPSPDGLLRRVRLRRVPETAICETGCVVTVGRFSGDMVFDTKTLTSAGGYAHDMFMARFDGSNGAVSR